MLVVDSEVENIYILLISDRNLRLGGKLVMVLVFWILSRNIKI